MFLASDLSCISMVVSFSYPQNTTHKSAGSAHGAPVVLTIHVHLYMGTPNDTLCAKVCTLQFSDCVQFICIDIGSLGAMGSETACLTCRCDLHTVVLYMCTLFHSMLTPADNGCSSGTTSLCGGILF